MLESEQHNHTMGPGGSQDQIIDIVSNDHSAFIKSDLNDTVNTTQILA